jgi:hypothetical protein
MPAGDRVTLRSVQVLRHIGDRHGLRKQGIVALGNSNMVDVPIGERRAVVIAVNLECDTVALGLDFEIAEVGIFKAPSDGTFLRNFFRALPTSHA